MSAGTLKAGNMNSVPDVRHRVTFYLRGELRDALEQFAAAHQLSRSMAVYALLSAYDAQPLTSQALDSLMLNHVIGLKEAQPHSWQPLESTLPVVIARVEIPASFLVATANATANREFSVLLKKHLTSLLQPDSLLPPFLAPRLRAAAERSNVLLPDYVVQLLGISLVPAAGGRVIYKS
jgi:hypothetical protein